MTSRPAYKRALPGEHNVIAWLKISQSSSRIPFWDADFQIPETWVQAICALFPSPLLYPRELQESLLAGYNRQIRVKLKLSGQFILFPSSILRYCGRIEQLLKCTTMVANINEYQQLEQLRYKSGIVLLKKLIRNWPSLKKIVGFRTMFLLSHFPYVPSCAR